MRFNRLGPTLCCLLAWSLGTNEAAADRSAYAGTEDLIAYGAALTVKHHHDWSNVWSDDGFRLVFSDRAPFGVDAEVSSLEFLDGQGRLVQRTSSPPLTYLWVAPDSRYVVGLSSIKAGNFVQLVVFDARGRLMMKRRITPRLYCMRQARYEQLRRRHFDAFKQLDQASRQMDLPFAWREGAMAYVALLWAPATPSWPRLFGDLITQKCESPYSPSFSETTTNFVFWYHEADPALEIIEHRGELQGVKLRDPKGEDMFIPRELIVLPETR